jgi:hypothetical protein
VLRLSPLHTAPVWYLKCVVPCRLDRRTSFECRLDCYLLMSSMVLLSLSTRISGTVTSTRLQLRLPNGYQLVNTLYYSIQINQQTRSNNFRSLLIDVYVWLNMFRSPFHPSSRAYNCNRSLWFYRWNVMFGTLLVWSADHDHQRSNHHAPTVEPEASSAVVRS